MAQLHYFQFDCSCEWVWDVEEIGKSDVNFSTKDLFRFSTLNLNLNPQFGLFTVANNTSLFLSLWSHSSNLGFSKTDLVNYICPFKSHLSFPVPVLLYPASLLNLTCHFSIHFSGKLFLIAQVDSHVATWFSLQVKLLLLKFNFWIDLILVGRIFSSAAPELSWRMVALPLEHPMGVAIMAGLRLHQQLVLSLFTVTLFSCFVWRK